MPPPREEGLQYFVDREQPTKTVLAYVDRRGELDVVDVAGVEGIGKSWFLQRLYWTVSERKDTAAAWASMAQYDPRLDHETEASLDASYDMYRQLLAGLAAELPASAFGDFESHLSKATVTVVVEGSITGATVEVGLNGRFYAGGDVGVVKVNVGPEAYVGQARPAVTHAFLERAAALAPERRLVIFVDGFDRVMKQPVGTWFLHEVVARLENSLVVVGRVASDDELDAPVVKTVAITNLPPEEVRAYAEKRLGPRPDLSELTDALTAFSGGHPHAISTAIDLVAETGVQGPEAVALFEDMPTGLREQLGTLVDKIVDAVSDDDVRAALKVAWVARRFDAKLLSDLLGTDDDANKAVDYGRIVGCLRRYSFVERADEKDPSVYRFHEFIRVGRDEELRDTDRDRYDDLNRRAAAYYRDRLQEHEENRAGRSSYLRAYRNEDPRWRMLKVEWLYHLGRLRHSTDACVAFAELYFDSFWWWGCYCRYAFCDELLVEWDKARSDSESAEWLEVLRDFHRAYPTGYEKHGRGDWVRVEDAVARVQTLAEIDGALAHVPPERRHLRALTDIFLAHARRYQQPDDPAIDKYYANARTLLAERPEDSWCLAWIEYELGDLALERGDLDEALARSGEALRIGREEEDDEVVANGHRLEADVRWQRGDVEGAVCCYERALCRAYAFLGLPEAPDPYELAFYDEMYERTAARIAELCAGGRRDEALRACATLQGAFAELRQAVDAHADGTPLERLLDAGRAAELATAVLACKPTDALVADSARARHAARVVERTVETLDADE